MTAQIIYLHTSDRQPSAPAIFVGRKYQLLTDTLPADSHGICGGFHCTTHSGGVTPLAATPPASHGYIWDADSQAGLASLSLANDAGEAITVDDHTPLASNRFVLFNATLTKPAIQTLAASQQLSLQARFDFVYTPEWMDARLGALNLVKSSCFAMLSNGEKHPLLESGEEEPVLFLNQAHANEAVSPILDAVTSNEAIRESHQEDINHTIPEQIEGIEVETLTVLEQYQTFFMQREQPFSPDTIWTPVCAPVSWGWSIRIARRYDGEWGIARQKLLMPTVGHNGLEMPAWQGNHLNLS
jgi:hypothetical protein